MRAEQEPRPELPVEASIRPPLGHVGVLREGGVGPHCFIEELCLPPPPRFGQILRLRLGVRELYAELPGQVEGRLDAGPDAVDASPEVSSVAAPAAAVAVEAAVGVDVEAGGPIRVVGARASADPRPPGLSQICVPDGELGEVDALPQEPEDAHRSLLAPPG